MTPLKTGRERFCRWFVELSAARAVGERRLTAKAAYTNGRHNGSVSMIVGIRSRPVLLTFVMEKNRAISMLYSEIVLTFVYRLEKALPVKSGA